MLGVERTIAAAPGVGSAFPGFLLLEVGQHLVIGEAGEPIGGPAVIVAAVATHIGHGIGRGGTTDHLAAGALHGAAADIVFRLAEIHPVVAAFGEDLSPAERNVNHRVAIPTACFKQQHGNLGVGAQTMGEYAACRSCPNDDVVIAFRVRHSFLLSPDVPETGTSREVWKPRREAGISVDLGPT